MWPCADTDGGDRDGACHRFSQIRGHDLQNSGERAGLLHVLGVEDEPLAGLPASLHLVAAELVHRLRGEPEVGHDRDTGAGQQLHMRQDPLAAFELDGVGAGLLHEPGGGRERLLRGLLIGPEGQVRDDHGAL